ncbi:cytochrome P450 [Dichotomocladium elegans]|nr:cytochrome P450 [Dichotomocladium elegans]
MKKICAYLPIGPIISVNFGVVPFVMIADPYLAHEIFNTNGSVTSNRPYQLFSHQYYAIHQRGLVFTPPSKRWKQTRTAVLEILAPKNVHNFEHLIYHELTSIVDYMINETHEMGSVKVVKPMQFATMNVILQTVLAKRAESPKDPLFVRTMRIIDEGMKMAGAAEDISTFIPAFKLFDVLFQKERKHKDLIENKRNPHFRSIIKDSIDSGKECLLKSLVDYQEKANEVDEDMILVTINDIVAAGADTTAITLSWFLVILCHHPELQQRLRDEVDDFIKKNKRYPVFADRDSFPLLISVQKECMRLRPTTSFGLLHEATEDLRVRDYFIPKGTTLVSSMYGMHHNEDIYPNADQFVPERFMDNQKPMLASANGPINARDHYNFGWGRRICAGIHLAEVEMFGFTTSLFAKAVILPKLNASGEPVLPDIKRAHDAGLVLHPVDEGEIRLVARKDAVKF